MKHIRTYENMFTGDDENFGYVKIKETGEIGTIMLKRKIKKFLSIGNHFSYLIELNDKNGKSYQSTYDDSEIKILTPEEVELYKNVKKYNI